MLGRVLELNKVIAETKKQKWELEENLLKLEKRLIELEKSCPKKYSKDDSKKQLDFSAVKILELEKRIEILVKYLPKKATDKSDTELGEIKAAFEQYKTEYEKVIATLVKPCMLLEMQNKVLRDNNDNLHKIRDEINKINDRRQMIGRVSELDGIVTLPILIMILKDIKRLNEADVFESFLRATGKDLRQEVRKPNLDEICKNVFGIDIRGTFETFTKKTETKAVDEITVDAQMQKLVNECWAAAKKKYRIEKPLNETAFNDFCGFFRTEIYLTCALETFTFTDHVQMNVGMAQKTFALWMNLKEVINPYVALSYAARRIQPTPRTEGLFRELSLWLRGLYERSYNQVPPFFKNNEGKISDAGFIYIGDQEERDLYKWKPPLTKIAMAKNHRDHSETVALRLPKEQTQLNPAGTSPVTQVPAKNPGAPVSLPDQIEPLTNILPGLGANPGLYGQGQKQDKNDDRPRLPSSPLQHVNMPQPVHIMPVNDYHQITISLHRDEQEKLNRLAVVIGKVMEYGVVADENELRKELSEYQSFSPEEKFSKLKDCIRKYQLTSNQCSSLMFIQMSVNDALPNYSEGSRYWFFSNAHADDARTVISKINSTNNPRVQIEALFSLRKILKKNGSTHLLPALDKILTTTYNMLCNNVENGEQALRSADVERKKNPDNKVMPVQFITTQDYCQMIIMLHKDEVERLHKLEVVIGKIMEHGVVADEAQMRKELAEQYARSNDEKIKKLKDCIRKYELTANQSSSLLYMSQEVSDAFKPYIEGTRYKLFWHAHAEDARKTVNEINSTDDARVLLEKLFALRKLLKKDKSQNLLPVIDRVLLKAYNVLSGALKPESASRLAM